MLLASCPAGYAQVTEPALPWQERLVRVVSPSYREGIKHQQQLTRELEQLPGTPHSQQSPQLGYQTIHYGPAGTDYTSWVEVELPEASPVDAVVLVAVDAAYRDFHGAGYGFPVRFHVEGMDGASRFTIADHRDADFPNPGGLPVWLPVEGRRVKRIRITMTKPWCYDPPAHIFALGEIMVLRGNRNLAAALPAAVVRASESFESTLVWRKTNLVDGQSVLGSPVMAEKNRTLGYHSRMEESADHEKWVEVDLTRDVPIDEVRLIGVSPRFPGRPGLGFPPRFRVEVTSGAPAAQPVVLFDHTASDFPNPASNPVAIRGHGINARFVRVTATKLWERADNFAFALAELQVYSGDQNIALDKKATSLDLYSDQTSFGLPRELTDGYGSERRLAEWPDWLKGLSRRRELEQTLRTLNASLAQTRATAVSTLRSAAWASGGLLLVGLATAGWGSRQARRREVEALRQRLARDLHDEIGSNLGSIALISEMGLRRPTGLTRAELENILRVSRETAESMRDILELIHQPARTTEDLTERLRDIAARLLAGLDWTFEVESPLNVPALDGQRHLLLGFKEALHNVRKHARAQSVRIRCSQAADLLRLEICDDGVGFDPAAATHGIGLVSLRRRARALGGKLHLESTPGRGTKLVLTARSRPRRITEK